MSASPGAHLAGGCLCGRVRYTAELDTLNAALCHYSMCKRTSGGFAAALVQVHPRQVRWHDEPGRYSSSWIAERLFCDRCGPPIGWAAKSGDDMDLMPGSFDDPSAFVPAAHGGAERVLESRLNTEALPRYNTDEITSTVERWRAAVREVPD